MRREFYDHILQGADATEENARDHARGIDWQSIPKHTENLPNLDFIDTVAGIDIWYDWKGDYYTFSDSEDVNESKRSRGKLTLLSLYERAGKKGGMFDKEFEYTDDEKKTFMEAVRNFGLYGETIYRSDQLKEAIQEISELIELANGFTLKETDGWFDNVTATRHTKQMKEAVKVLQKEAEEILTRQQRLEAAYEDLGGLLNRYYKIER